MLARSQGAGAPRVASYFLSGLKIGEVSNDGSDNTDFVTAVNAQVATRGTAYAGFDQSYASITPSNNRSSLIFALHTCGAIVWTFAPSLSTATVTGKSFTSNS